MAAPDFPGVKVRSDGRYYYDDGDIPNISIPLSESVEGDLQITEDQLENWCSIDNSTLPTVPSSL